MVNKRDKVLSYLKSHIKALSSVVDDPDFIEEFKVVISELEGRRGRSVVKDYFNDCENLSEIEIIDLLKEETPRGMLDFLAQRYFFMSKSSVRQYKGKENLLAKLRQEIGNRETHKIIEENIVQMNKNNT